MSDSGHCACCWRSSTKLLLRSSPSSLAHLPVSPRAQLLRRGGAVAPLLASVLLAALPLSSWMALQRVVSAQGVRPRSAWCLIGGSGGCVAALAAALMQTQAHKKSLAHCVCWIHRHHGAHPTSRTMGLAATRPQHQQRATAATPTHAATVPPAADGVTFALAFAPPQRFSFASRQLPRGWIRLLRFRCHRPRTPQCAPLTRGVSLWSPTQPATPRTDDLGRRRSQQPWPHPSSPLGSPSSSSSSHRLSILELKSQR